MSIFPQHHGSHYLPIFVLPVRPNDNQSWHLAPSVGLRLQTVNVIFSVNLNSTDIQTLGAIQSWNGGRLYGVSQHIRVDKVYKYASSIIIIFAVTFAIWHSLPKDPAISFIGFEYNEDAALRGVWAQR
ncbi:hypothetical protein ACKRZS_001859 [Fusarium odoratissimum]